MDAIVIGGGLAGLIAAAKLAQAGRRVTLLEQSKQLGGRATTNDVAGVHFNLGPRALYCQGHAFRLFRELEIPFSGRVPNPGTSLGYYQEREYRLPTTLSSLLMTRLLSLREKWQLAEFLRQLPWLDTHPLQRTSVQNWLHDRFGRGALTSFLSTFFRLTSYAAEMHSYSVGAALDQLKIGLSGNVWYLNHGWQSLVDQLRKLVAELGVDMRSGQHVTAVRREENILAVNSKDDRITADAVIIAVNPQRSCSLLDLPAEHPLAAWTNHVRPVRAACLDIALTTLSRPQHRFALGLDQPYYFSVHSAAAELGPKGVAVIHTMKYLLPEESGQDAEQELENMLSRVQPGWQSCVLSRRYLPSMLVAPDVPQANYGGLTGRPLTDAAKIPGVFLAGDWIGARGQLADASAASAEEAAQSVMHFLEAKPVTKLQYV